MDKLLHFTAGMVIFWVASYFMACPIIPVIVIGMLKEVYDEVIKHSYADVWDIVVTVAGGLVMWLIIFIDLVVV